jgi:parvulin-like peptidyl-prolyl isomerase
MAESIPVPMLRDSSIHSATAPTQVSRVDTPQVQTQPVPAAAGKAVPAGPSANKEARGQRPFDPNGPARQRAAARAEALPKVVAVVNGEEIFREELARECLRQFGEAVLEILVNKKLIAQECQRRGITITEADVWAEIDATASRFNLGREQLFKMLREERDIDPDRYAEDIIWPIVAIRRLAGQQLQVTQEELLREYESRYGEAIRARMIVCNDRATAEKIRQEALADPEKFGQLARQHSVDPTSASLDGLVQPIRRHLGPKEVEEAAFSLPNGGISEVIPVADQFVIIKREERLPPSNVTFEQVRLRLVEMVRDRKIRELGAEVFRKLQDSAQIVNVWNDPQRSREMPGVAALVNGEQITVRELAEACLDRHGEEVLEGLIGRRLITQALRRANLEVTPEDIDAEIARAAGSMLPPGADGKPDVKKWLALATEQLGVSEELYRSEVVWRAVALRKLVASRVKVSDEDLQKAFEANYGPRVRALAIVLDDLRRAQRVWELARANPTRENFGQLAAEYSIDPAARTLRGEIPPIQKHGGQPLLEQEAFKLKPGELSGIIDIGGGKYVILLCEGQTKPVEVDFQSVRDLLYEDLYEKKMRVEMAQYFDQLRDQARIVNFLTGTRKEPAQPAAATANLPVQKFTPLPPRR